MIYWRVFFILFPIIIYSLISFLRMLFQLQPVLDHLSTQHFSWAILTVLLSFTLLPDLRLSSEVVVAEFGVERRDTEAVLCLTITFLEDFIDFILFFKKKKLLGYSCFKILCYFVQYSKVNRFSSVAKSCPILCDPMDCSMPGLPVHHQFPEPAQTDDHWVSDTIQPSHPLSSSSPPAFNLS